MMRAKGIKNLTKVADQSAWGVKLYYSLNENAVYTEDAVGRWYITEFLRKNTEDEIVSVVNRWLSM